MHARRSLVYLSALVPSVALLQGCAAILGSKTADVAAVSEPPGAEIYLDGVRAGVTPDTITVESKKSHTMTFRAPGYREESCRLTSSVDGGWIILDVLLGGLVGVIVDAATGEWNELSDKSCNLALTPDNAATPPIAANNPDSVPGFDAPPQGIRSFQSSAPDEIVSDAFKTQRRFVVGDMLRANVATSVEQGPPGILRVGVERDFRSNTSRELYFRKLASAYYTWAVDEHPLVIEIWEGGRKIGEYSDGLFQFGPGYTKPLDCPQDATSGPCSLVGQAIQRRDSTAPAEPREAAPPQPSTQASSTMQRSGFHFGLGLGGGSADLACDGCESGDAGFSGFLSLGRSIGDKTVLGVESTGWTRSESGASTQVYSLMAHVTEYVSLSSGLYLRAGLGLVGYRDETDLGDVSANALGFSGRLGYEIGSGSFVFAPYLGFVRTFGGADFKREGEDIGFNAAISNVQVGLSIGAH
jgi:hypothetical protein